MQFVMGMKLSDEFTDYHCRDSSTVPIKLLEFEGLSGRWKIYELFHILHQQYYLCKWELEDLPEMTAEEVLSWIATQKRKYDEEEQKRVEATSYVLWVPRVYHKLPPTFDNPCRIPPGYALLFRKEVKPDPHMQRILLEDDELQESQFVIESSAGLEYFVSPDHLQDPAINDSALQHIIQQLHSFCMLHIRVDEIYRWPTLQELVGGGS